MPQTRTQSSLLNSQRFIEQSFQKKDDLDDNGLLGLTQMAFLFISGSIEDCLSKIIDARYEAILKINYSELKPIHCVINDVRVHHDNRLIISSMKKVIEADRKEIKKLTFNKLKEKYNEIFDENINSVLGKRHGSDNNINQDLTAIASIRNMIAHGRPIIYEGKTQDLLEEINFNNHPFEEAKKSLSGANIFDFTSQNFCNAGDLQKKIFSFESLKYFNESATEARNKLINKMENEWEKFQFSHIEEKPILNI